jgi:hypothetical protein
MEEPRLPGSETPTDGKLPARVYPSALTIGDAVGVDWAAAGMGSRVRALGSQGGGAADGVDTRDPFTSFYRLHFRDRQRAIDFVERHGWRYVAQPPPVRSFRIRSYADNFR